MAGKGSSKTNQKNQEIYKSISNLSLIILKRDNDTIVYLCLSKRNSFKAFYKTYKFLLNDAFSLLNNAAHYGQDRSNTAT